MRKHLIAAAALVPLLAACSLTGNDDNATTSNAPAGTTGAKNTKVTLVVHDSWNPPKGALEQFTKETGYQVTVLKSGDAGAMTNKLVLTKDSPLGDAVYGIDNTFASRAVQKGALAEYQVADAPAGVGDHAASGDGAKYLTPVDFGDVCMNVDTTWFDAKKVPAPKTLDDLKDARYKGLTVVPGATSSSPGLAFLLATVGKYQDGWKQYWKDLLANDAKVVSGWEQAYNTEFTQGSGGKGTRPVVLSYASSPPFTIAKATGKPTTAALLDTCFRQTEYAGVLAGAKNPEGAKALVGFLVSKTFQDGIAENMYMYPVVKDAAIPADWKSFAPLATTPLDVSSDDIEANRETWLREWQEIAAK